MPQSSILLYLKAYEALSYIDMICRVSHSQRILVPSRGTMRRAESQIMYPQKKLSFPTLRTYVFVQ
jgi:hypothetical protein